MMKKYMILFSMMWLIFMACSQAEKAVTPDSGNENPGGSSEVWTWPEAQPEDVGMNGDLLDELRDARLNGQFSLYHSVVVVRHGKLVKEYYFSGRPYQQNRSIQFTRDTRHYAASTTKSFSATLIAMLMHQGQITGVDEKLPDLLPSFSNVDWSGGKGGITLENLLTMSAGFEWDEWIPYSDPRNSLIVFSYKARPLDYLLSRPMAAHPGERFVYNSGISCLLLEIVREKTGQRADLFAREQLFKPLGISNYTWLVWANGIVHGGGGLDMLPRDMAKLGQLYLNHGEWEGQQLFDSAWPEAATQSLYSPVRDSDKRYGYQWWVETFHSHGRDYRTWAAEGHGGQFILVIPELDLVVATTGGYYESNPDPDLRTMMETYILPAVTNP